MQWWFKSSKIPPHLVRSMIDLKADPYTFLDAAILISTSVVQPGADELFTGKPLLSARFRKPHLYKYYPLGCNHNSEWYRAQRRFTIIEPRPRRSVIHNQRGVTQ